MKTESKQYNDEPVYFCARCLSLSIMDDLGDYCYCDNCGSTNIQQATIEEWEKKYVARYGYRLMDKKLKKKKLL